MVQHDPLMNIGVFSRASLVSVKALRLYHEQGLLVPASIDPGTGYRSYRISQLGDAQVIKRLRDLDVPLRAVAEILAARNPEVTRRIIAEHEEQMRERLTDLSRIVNDLQASVQHPQMQTPAHIREEVTQHALAISQIVFEPGHDAYAAFLDVVFASLWQTMRRLGVYPSGASGALYPPEVDAEAEQITAFIPIAEAIVLDDQALAANVANFIIPPARCAVLTHTGSYRTMHETYRQLGAWVVSNATPANHVVRERYVVSIDPLTGKLLPDEQLVTEIAWPIL